MPTTPFGGAAIAMARPGGAPRGLAAAERAQSLRPLAGDPAASVPGNSRYSSPRILRISKDFINFLYLS